MYRSSTEVQDVHWHKNKERKEKVTRRVEDLESCVLVVVVVVLTITRTWKTQRN
jgi:hypothetical protein